MHHIWDDYPEIQKKLEQVKHIMLSELTPIPSDIRQNIEAYINASGKFIRAGICLLFAQYANNSNEMTLYRAASIELLHLATLLHDDVIDEADTRRHLNALHKTFSNKIAIYAGDYLLAYSARLAKKGYGDVVSKELGNDRLMELILAGEIRQLYNQHNHSMSLDSYLKQIRGKTAQMFGLATQAGVFHTQSTVNSMRCAYQAGIMLGMAFQLADDVLDYEWENQKSGKPRYQDVQNGIYTAPVLFAKDKDSRIHNLLAQNQWDDERLYEFHELLIRTQAILSTKKLYARYLIKCEKYMTKLFSKDECKNFKNLLNQIFI